MFLNSFKKQLGNRAPRFEPWLEPRLEQDDACKSDIINGASIYEYDQYLQEKEDKICLMKEQPEYKELPKQLLEDECLKATRKLNAFRTNLDDIIKNILSMGRTCQGSEKIDYLLVDGTLILARLSEDTQGEIKNHATMDFHDPDDLIKKYIKNIVSRGQHRGKKNKKTTKNAIIRNK